MKDAPAFDFYPERWLAGVAEFSDSEQLAFLRLLCHQWLKQGLPSEVAVLRRLAGKGVSSALLEKFPECEDGQRRNAKLEQIRSEQRARIAKRSEQRKAAADARWSKERCGKDAVASPPHMRTDADAMPTTHHPPPTPTLGHPSPHTRGVPTLEQVKAHAATVLMTDQEADDYWLAREASGWQRSSNGTATAVGNWKADFQAFTRAARQRKADEEQRGKRYANKPKATAYDIQPSWEKEP